ncbi:MAG: flagellar export chaperone FlgN [Lachnospiraceae bacterium]|nr:flagellar export chaperone FlgN [Lachnospiraceae bacterium]
MMGNYLDALEQSLVEKSKVLDQIQEYNSRQEEIFKSEIPELALFDSYVEEKGQLIERLNKLDEGFEILFDSVKKELDSNRPKYQEHIKRLKQLVSEVMEKSVTVQAQEQRNKKLVEEFFSKEKSGIGQGRRNSKAAYDYYKTMNKANVVSPQFMDKKK